MSDPDDQRTARGALREVVKCPPSPERIWQSGSTGKNLRCPNEERRHFNRRLQQRILKLVIRDDTRMTALNVLCVQEIFWMRTNEGKRSSHPNLVSSIPGATIFLNNFPSVPGLY